MSDNTQIIYSNQEQNPIELQRIAHLSFDIRFALNTVMDSMNPMGLVLVGQLELWDRQAQDKRIRGPSLLSSKQDRIETAPL